MGWSECCDCKTKMWLPDELESAARRSRGADGISFYCAYGHGQHYAQGETEEARLRRERDRLKQDAARLMDERGIAERRAAEATERAEKAEAAQRRLKKRTAAGTCPCCQRTFSNMSTHMKRQHPQFVTDTGAKVAPIKAVSSH